MGSLVTTMHSLLSFFYHHNFFLHQHCLIIFRCPHLRSELRIPGDDSAPVSCCSWKPPLRHRLPTCYTIVSSLPCYHVIIVIICCSWKPPLRHSLPTCHCHCSNCVIIVVIAIVIVIVIDIAIVIAVITNVGVVSLSVKCHDCPFHWRTIYLCELASSCMLLLLLLSLPMWARLGSKISTLCKGWPAKYHSKCHFS